MGGIICTKCDEHTYGAKYCGACVKKLEREIRLLKEALRPFAHPDLHEILGGNAERDNSNVFQRNNAVVTIGDFRRAARRLKRRKL